MAKLITTDNIVTFKAYYDAEIDDKLQKLGDQMATVKGGTYDAGEVNIADTTNRFNAVNVEDALIELKDDIVNATGIAEVAKYDDVQTLFVDVTLGQDSAVFADEADVRTLF